MAYRACKKKPGRPCPGFSHQVTRWQRLLRDSFTVGIEGPIESIRQREIDRVASVGESRFADPEAEACRVERLGTVDVFPPAGIEAVHHGTDEPGHLGSVEGAMARCKDECLTIERRSARLADRVFIGRQVGSRGARVSDAMG